MRFAPSLLVASIVVACSGKTDTSGTQGTGAQGQTAAAGCDGKPVPPHECFGGVPAPRCNLVNGEARWQLDCVPRDPNAPPDVRGVSPCDAQQCGAEPAWDANDCLYGFASEASCESFDRGACTWTRLCRPKPCSAAEGTCNILHRDRLGDACKLGSNEPCPSGYSCGTISVDIGERVGPVCIAHPPCDAITCGAGTSCSVLESYPIQIICGK